MAQIDQGLYYEIANAYAAIDTSLSTVSTNARTALDAVVNVTTGAYPDPSNDPDAALEIELALLSPFNNAYTGSRNLANSVGALLDAIRAINNHVINNSSYSGTATQKLDNWINVEMHAGGGGGVGETWANVPAGWKNLCEDAGYTVTAWT